MNQEITPLVLTYNEEPNISRLLNCLDWTKEIVVIDSFSTDATSEISRSFKNVRLLERKFDTFASQCNFGLQQIKTDWVLSLDADYVLSDELIEEIKTINPLDRFSGYSARFKYCVYGHPLRASLYPPRTVLYRRDEARYHDEGHGHRVRVQGQVNKLKGVILHDDRKPLDGWFASQNRYAALETQHLLNTAKSELNFPDRLRCHVVIAPFLVLLYTLFGKGLIVDGWAGWFYVFQRTLAEILLSLRLIEERLKRNGKGS